MSANFPPGATSPTIFFKSGAGREDSNLPMPTGMTSVDAHVYFPSFLRWLEWVGSNHRVSASETSAFPLGYTPIWCTRFDLNERPLGFQASALTELSYRCVVGDDGFEPPCGIPDLQSGAFDRSANPPVTEV